MDMFEKYYLKDTPFILSNEISIADLMAVTEYNQFEVGAFMFYVTAIYILTGWYCKGRVLATRFGRLWVQTLAESDLRLQKLVLITPALLSTQQHGME